MHLHLCRGQRSQHHVTQQGHHRLVEFHEKKKGNDRAVKKKWKEKIRKEKEKRKESGRKEERREKRKKKKNKILKC